MSSRCVVFFICFLISILALAQEQGDLNARDVFWSASDLVTVQPNATNAAKMDSVNSVSSSPKVTSGPAGTNTKKTASSAATAQHAKGSNSVRAKDTNLDPDKVSALGYGAKPQVLGEQMLGLRYTMLKGDVSGSYSEILPSGIFHSGDRIRLSIMSNQLGYLYIIEQGTSGNWKPLFPREGTPEDTNRVEPGRLYQFPTTTNSSFQFDQRPGTEHLFLLLSKSPISDIGALVTSMQGPHGTGDSTQSKDGGAVYAKNKVGHADLGELPKVRDLVMTVIGDAPEQGTSEKAVYVVSKASLQNASAMIVAELALKHE